MIMSIKLTKPRITGVIIDNQRRPICNARVSRLGRIITRTKEDGSFCVRLKRANSRVILSFSADGYVTNTKTFNSKSSGGNVVVIWPVAYRVKFNPLCNLDIMLGSTSISVPAGSLISYKGAKHKSLAEISFTLFDVTNSTQRAAAPGEFSGRMRDGTIVRLNSYGIFDFHIRDLRKRPLALREGSQIDFSIPLPVRLKESAPKKIGYFDFDLKSGKWIEVGNFTFEPETLSYNGSVTRFGGPQNLDDPQETTCVKVQVVRLWDGVPAANMNVVVDGLDYSSTGVTDSNGYVCFLVQRNAQFLVTASGQIGTSSYSSYPQGQSFMAPNFASSAGDCSDPILCPFLGQVTVDLIS
jgi:hypothetical protein